MIQRIIIVRPNGITLANKAITPEPVFDVRAAFAGWFVLSFAVDSFGVAILTGWPL